MSTLKQGSQGADQLIEFARANLDFEGILRAYSRGGEFTLLFLKSSGNKSADAPFIWINAWLANEEHILKIESCSDHLQGRYIQRGFHPGFGSQGNSSFYEPIYGGPAEPLVLGWSADDKRIDPELSQELERCYKLSRTVDENKIVWNSWQEAIDEVVVLDRSPLE